MRISYKTSVFKLILGVIALSVLSGCQMGRGTFIPGVRDQYKFEDLAKHRPQNRIGTLASNSVVTVYSKSSKLGIHGYAPNGSEQNGMIYTCRGGHIDLAHLRNAADWTGYTASNSFKHLDLGDKEFSFRIGEGGKCLVKVEYPLSWEYLFDKDKSRISKELSFRLGEYLAYQFSIWHEIVTWFGYKSAGIYPEFESSFSWEDSYSNLLGCRIGYMALTDTRNRFSKAVTKALEKEMQVLRVQPVEVAKEAARQIRNGNIANADYKTRNFDVGLDDGYITPWLVECMGDCDVAVPRSYPVPTLDFAMSYGFGIKVEIEPRVWEKDQILQVVFGDDYKKNKYIDPSKEFVKIMSYIEQMAADRYGMSVTDYKQGG